MVRTWQTAIARRVMQVRREGRYGEDVVATHDEVQELFDAMRERTTWVGPCLSLVDPVVLRFADHRIVDDEGNPFHPFY